MVDTYASFYKTFDAVRAVFLFGIVVSQLTSCEWKRVDDLFVNVDYFISYLRVGHGSIELEHSEWAFLIIAE